VLPESPDVHATILTAAGSRRGHFVMESGYHTDLWLDLERLCRRPEIIQPFARALAERLRPCQVDAVCGPLNEGAFVALMVASELGCDFTYAERVEMSPGSTEERRRPPTRVTYALPHSLRPVVTGRRVAIVNDVVSAGSAVRGALADLLFQGAEVVAVAALLVLGDAFPTFAREQRLAVESLARVPFNIWAPDACPLCADRVVLENVS
jgi:orotate phosphoribosyltransferase